MSFSDQKIVFNSLQLFCSDCLQDHDNRLSREEFISGFKSDPMVIRSLLHDNFRKNSSNWYKDFDEVHEIDQ